MEHIAAFNRTVEAYALDKNSSYGETTRLIKGYFTGSKDYYSAFDYICGQIGISFGTTEVYTKGEYYENVLGHKPYVKFLPNNQIGIDAHIDDEVYHLLEKPTKIDVCYQEIAKYLLYVFSKHRKEIVNIYINRY